MVQITILGSLKDGETYEVLVPRILDEELYRKDHEAAYRKATNVLHPFIEKSELVVVYAPDGIGEHTQRDLDHTISSGVDYTIFPEDVNKAHLYDGLGLDLRVLKFEYDLSSLLREVKFLRDREKDHERLRTSSDREFKKLRAAFNNIEKEYMRWKKLAPADDCMKKVGAIVERLGL